MPDNPMLRFLQAADWPEAIDAADAELRDPQWLDLLAATVDDAEAEGNDALASMLRRHAAVLAALQAEGPAAALRVAAGRVDPDEPKDRQACIRVLAAVSGAEPAGMVTLVGEYPWLLTDATDRIIRRTVDGFVEQAELALALDGEYRRLLLRAFRRSGTAATLAVIDPRGDAAQRSEHLREAVLRAMRAGDVEDELLRKLAWFLGHAEPTELAAMLNDIGASLMVRYRRAGELADLMFALLAYRVLHDGLGPAPTGPLAVYATTNLAGAMMTWEQATGDLRYRREAIALYRAHLVMALPDDPMRLASAVALAGLLIAEGRVAGQGPELFEEAGKLLAAAIPVLAGVDEQERIIGLLHVATMGLVRFDRTGDSDQARRDVAAAVDAIRALSRDDPQRRRLAQAMSQIILHSLATRRDVVLNDAAAEAAGIAGDTVAAAGRPAGALLDRMQALLNRYEASGSPDDLRGALDDAQEVLRDAVPGSEDELVARTGLGNALKMRFAATGDIADLDAAVTHLRQAVEAQQRSGGPPILTAAFQNLSGALVERYQHARRPEDLDDAVVLMTHLLDGTTPDDPLRLGRASTLAAALRQRYLHRKDRADLDQVIALVRAELTGATAGRAQLSIVQSTLALGLRDRYLADGDPADAHEAAALLRTAVLATAATSPYLEPLVSNYLLVLTAIPVRAREQRGQDITDLQRWIAVTQRDVLRQCRETADVRGALASVTVPSEQLQPDRSGPSGGADRPEPPEVPDVDPDGLQDDAAPRSLLVPPTQFPLPEHLVVFARRAADTTERYLDGADPADLDEAVALWRAAVRHPAFAGMSRPEQRQVALMAARNAYLLQSRDDSVAGVDRLIDAYELLLSLADDDESRVTIACDLGRTRLQRFGSSGDDTDLDLAFDGILAAVAPLAPGGASWRRAVRYLAGCFQRYPERDSIPAGRKARLDQLATLVGRLGADGTGPIWVPIRLMLLDAYGALGRDPDQRMDALTRSARIAEDAATAARAAGDQRQATLFEQIGASTRNMITITKQEAEEHEVTVPELMAPTDDPEEAGWRLERMRILYQRTDPAEDYEAWRYVATGLLVLLNDGATTARADQLDEILELAAALERNATARGDTEAQRMAVSLQRETYLERIHGSRVANLDRAVECAERRLALSPDGSLDQAVSRAELGFALNRRVAGGRPAPDDASRAVRESRAAAAALGDAAEPATRARVHYLLAGVLADHEEPSLAENLEAAIEAYGVAMRHQSEGSTDWANTHHQLGLMYTFRLRANREENLAVALEHFDLELTVFTRERYPSDWAYAMVSRGNALSQARSSDPRVTAARAAASFESALTVFTQQAYPSQWARIRASQGLLALDADRIGGRDVDARAALEHLNAALQVYDRERDPAEWARVHEFLTVGELILAREGEVEHDRRAIDHAEQALSLPGLPPVTRARRLANLGSAHLELAEYAPQVRAAHLGEAAAALGEALSLFDRHGLLPEVRTIAAGLAETYSWQGLWQHAVQVYEVGIAAAERRYAESLLISSRAAELRDGGRLVRAGVRALVHAGRTADAVVALERGRARWLGESMDRDRADLGRLAADHPRLAEAFRQAAALVTDAETAERDTAGDARGAELRERAGQARAALDEHSARIRRLPGYEGFLGLPDLSDVARAVGARSAVTYLLPGDQEGLVLIAHRGTGGDLIVSARPLPELTTTAVDRLLRDEGYLAAQIAGGGADLRRVLEPVLTALGTMLAGAAEALRELGPESVTLIPCGRLAVLPVHAAPYPTATGPRTLLDEFVVAFAPSAWVLSHPTGADVPPVLAGVGNPTGDLRFAGTELADIAELFPRTDPGRLLFGPAATREAVLAQLPGATYLHLSCHGYYDLAQPNASHLLLAAGDRLTLGELLAGSLLQGVRLAVASACQTAISDVMRLPDEAIGLPAGFLRAGASAVVGTLWPVADLPTALLMRRFYEYHLTGDPDVAAPVPMTPAWALRSAQHWLAGLTEAELAAYFAGQPMVRSGDLIAPRPFAHPYYWAPFVLAGQ